MMFSKQDLAILVSSNITLNSLTFELTSTNVTTSKKEILFGESTSKTISLVIQREETLYELLNKYHEKLEKLDKILMNSDLTEDDAIVIGKKIKRGIAKRHKI